jgi:hypothetical protein
MTAETFIGRATLLGRRRALTFLRGASVAELDRWGERFVTASSLETIFA